MYQIRRGWPSNAALDEIFEAATGQTIADGMIVTLTAGKATPATYAAAAAVTDPVPAFVIGLEKVKGKITGLLSQCIIEVDAQHYASASYASGDMLTANNGKFSKVTATGEKAIARVLSMDASTGIMRLLWFASC